jgi:hypothetical protein
MTCKFLEISLGKNLLPTRLEIFEVEKGIFMLKTKNSHVGLLGTLEKWLNSNNLIGEPCYKDMLWERSSSMRQMRSEDDDANGGLMVSAHPILEEMIQEAD